MNAAIKSAVVVCALVFAGLSAAPEARIHRLTIDLDRNTIDCLGFSSIVDRDNAAPREPAPKRGWLARYAALVGCASQGATLTVPAPSTWEAPCPIGR